MSRSTLAGNRFNFGTTTEPPETMNQMEQVVVFVVVGVAMILFLGVFVVFVCRCNKRCPTYRYSIVLFDQPPIRGGGVGGGSMSGLPRSTTSAQSLNKRTTIIPTMTCSQLPPYSEEWTLQSDAPRPETPPPEYDLVCELVPPLPRPPSYQFKDENESDNS